MKNYRFSMEKILDWRTDQEEEAQKKVSAIKETKRNEDNALNQLLNESKRIKGESIFHSSIDSFKRHSLYTDLINDRIVQQRLKIEQVEKELSEAQQLLLQAHKNKKMMEKLDGKERERYKETAKKEEQKHIDEMSTIQYGHNLMSH